MRIKSIQTSINSEFVNLQFPNSKNIVLRGDRSKCENIIYLLECILLNDYTDYYGGLDRQKGYNYHSLDSQTIVTFSDGAMLGKEKHIEKSGTIPKFHVIRYIAGSEIRSFYISNSMKSKMTSVMQYSKDLTYEEWIRLVANVNRVCGVEFCSIDNNTLVFNEQYKDDINFKLIYLLISECFVTPEGYTRVILLPNIDSMSSKQQLALIETLDNFPGHEVIISSCKIDSDDIPVNSCVTFLSV